MKTMRSERKAMIEDGQYNALCDIARDRLPNLVVRDDEGIFVRWANKRDVVDAATNVLEDAWGIELDTGEYNTDDERGIWEAYQSTHITAAGRKEEATFPDDPGVYRYGGTYRMLKSGEGRWDGVITSTFSI